MNDPNSCADTAPIREMIEGWLSSGNDDDTDELVRQISVALEYATARGFREGLREAASLCGECDGTGQTQSSLLNDEQYPCYACGGVRAILKENNSG